MYTIGLNTSFTTYMKFYPVSYQKLLVLLILTFLLAYYVMVFDLRWEVIVCFVDIGGSVC